MREYPVGSQVLCRFSFVLRKLTPNELEAFESGLGLPSGVGTDPATVVYESRGPDHDTVTIEGAAIVKDGVGLYHTIIPVTAAGPFLGRGRGTTGGGAPVACTPDIMFKGTRTF